MLMHNDAADGGLDRPTALFELEADILGAKRCPVPMATAAAASALIVLATAPLTSPLVVSTSALFSVFAVHLVLMADAELARRVTDHLIDVGIQSEGR